MKTKRMNEVSRRSFIGTIGAAAAATALPVGALAGGITAAARSGKTGNSVLPVSTGAAPDWRSACTAWPDAVAEMKAQTDAIVARFRPAYFEEVRKLAETLRPRIATEELSDYPADDDDETPFLDGRHRLEELCAEHFGVVVTANRQTGECHGDEVLAEMICAVSPSAERWDPREDWSHPGYCAKACIADDVLRAAGEARS